MNTMAADSYILSFDTANEVVSIALGIIHKQTREVELVAQSRIEAHRASNTKLLPAIDALLTQEGIARSSIAAIACGRGPGSFTGVRICMATAKGIASALEVALIGVSTLDALAWELQKRGARGRALVVADAMRREVYPVQYELSDAGIARLNTDAVVLAEVFNRMKDDVSHEQGAVSAPVGERGAASAPAASAPAGERGAASAPDPDALRTASTPEPDTLHVALGDLPSDTFDVVAGDALIKYQDIFASWGPCAEQDSWTVTGEGLLACVQQMWQEDICDPFDAQRHDPALVLPVYTRLSDAEENERARLATTTKSNLRTGVEEVAKSSGPLIQPLAASDVERVAEFEAQLMEGDAWNESMLLDDIARKDRSWWVALDEDKNLMGYAGGQIVAGMLQLFKIAVAPHAQRHGVASSLLAQLADDARNLGATEMTLEVRASNSAARAFYEHMNLVFQGMRPGYYQDGEDAAIYTGPLPTSAKDVAGMDLIVDQAASASSVAPVTPYILAIESSCDETAAALIDGDGHILADTIASQIDFHARFGGVVPEIASRKHIEAICGVTQVCLENAASMLNQPRVRYRDLDAIAVTYAPGLVGALVVGVAFAKGAAWAADIPLIQVNHLEGHLYANKFATPDIAPPMVVSLVSGGHTMLVHVRDWGDYEILGGTIDDAVGEAFDKVAKALGLGYPGGPIISEFAKQGDAKAIDFPRAMMHSGDYRFSLSGLKTAVATYINEQREAGIPLNIPDIAASFQAAVIDVQVSKACKALDETGAREFCLGGGVAANPALRAAYEQACAQRGVRLTMPPASMCTDNASMIALVALDRFAQQKFATLDADAYAHANLEEAY